MEQEANMQGAAAAAGMNTASIRRMYAGQKKKSKREGRDGGGAKGREGGKKECNEEVRA